jgi:hypothetical protein
MHPLTLVKAYKEILKKITNTIPLSCYKYFLFYSKLPAGKIAFITDKAILFKAFASFPR